MSTLKSILLGVLLISSTCLANQSYPVREVKTNSPKDIVNLFNSLGYTKKAWESGIKEVPRVYLQSIPKRWAKESRNLPVKLKKELFFRLLAPAILTANESILIERQKVEEALKAKKPLSISLEKEMVFLAHKYKLVKKDQSVTVDDKTLNSLLLHIDAIPVSLALAQGANESGWGTSRFALLGNSLFGQWDFSGKGIAPKQQRKEYGNYGLARFDRPQDAVNAYLLNLNTHRAYAKLRKMRAGNRQISGYKLATSLNKYSERGEAYVKDIQQMIHFNHLEATDKAYLSEKEIIKIIPVK